MTNSDGPETRLMADKKWLEEVEKGTKDLQGAVQHLSLTVDGLEASMLTVHTALVEHASRFDSIMTKLEQIFARMDQCPPPKDDDSNGGPKSSNDDTKSSQVMLPRMDLPTFDGSDPLAWLAQAKQYFLVHKTATEQKVQLALIAMSGNTMFWAQWVLHRSTAISWANFSRELVARFGDSSAVNAYEALHLTSQMGSLEDYLSLFEARVAQLPTLPLEHELGAFLGGLQPHIRDKLPDLELQDVFVAIRAARCVARSTRPPTSNHRPMYSIPNYSRSPSTFHKPTVVSGAPPAASSASLPHSQGPQNSRRMSVAQ